MEVSSDRRNLFVHRGHPSVVLTTHADTVPPFLPPRREGDVLVGRGACDAKASLAAQAVALEELARDGTSEVGLLVLVGEERGSDGALAANRRPHLARYLIGGEPTGSRFVAGSKGCLRIEVEARGVAGHSSIPDSGRSAVEPLLDFLGDLRALRLPEHPTFGGTTMNIGVLQAGTAPNVIAESARAEVIFRTGESIETLLAHVRPIAEGRVSLTVGYRSDPVTFRCPKGEAGEIVSFACDLPLLPAWGEPILFGGLGAQYDKRYGLKDEHLAEISKINYANAKKNPNAQTRTWYMNKEHALCRTDDNPAVGGRIRIADCSQVTDGAVCVFLASR